ncbi:MAG: hypothetical protein IT438_03795 [Phycisphaerales bacterium]|nr:hypothetical protein [Phycisphaerales bacterium]
MLCRSWSLDLAFAGMAAIGLAAPAPAVPGSCCAPEGTCRIVADVAACDADELAIADGVCVPSPCPIPGPTNDLCTSARVLPGGAVGVYYGTTAGAVSQLASSSCAAGDPIDVWFRFTNTRPFEFTYNFNTEGTPAQNENGGDTTIELFDACPTAGGESLGCDDNGAGNGRSRVILTLLEGEGVRIRVAFRGGPTSAGMFRLNISDQVAPPANDLCASATIISASPSVTIADNSRATGTDITPCGPNDQRDVWFTFTPTIGGQYVFDTVGSVGNDDATLAVFSGCPPTSLTLTPPAWPTNLLVCNDDIDAGWGVTDAKVRANLAAGSAYKIRVSGYNNTEGAFRLNLAGPLPAMPLVPDTCEIAIPIGGSFEGTFYTGGARPDAPPGGCNSGAAQIEGVLDNAVWFTFVPAEDGPLSGVVDGTSGEVRGDGLLLLLEGACAGPLTELACLDGPEPFDLSQMPSVLAGRRYFLVFGDGGVFDGGGDVVVNISIPGGESSGACCEGSICTLKTAANCAGPSTRFAGAGVACNSYPSDVVSPCCLADFNKNATGAAVSVQDLFDFLTAYFAGDVRANINGSVGAGEPTLSVQDIFDFLAAYFSGC